MVTSKGMAEGGLACLYRRAVIAALRISASSNVAASCPSLDGTKGKSREANAGGERPSLPLGPSRVGLPVSEFALSAWRLENTCLPRELV